MKKIFVFGICLAFLMTGTVFAAQPSEMVFVGFTTATIEIDGFYRGNSLFAMTKLCQAEYENSRMCTSEEVMKTVNIPELPDFIPYPRSTSIIDWGWVQPVITSIYVNEDGEIFYVDISGQSGKHGLNCNNWTVPRSDWGGLAVNVIGNFEAPGCNRVGPVACCAPSR